MRVIDRINGSTVDFLKEGVVVSTRTIDEAGEIVEIIPESDIVFDLIFALVIPFEKIKHMITTSTCNFIYFVIIKIKKIASIGANEFCDLCEQEPKRQYKTLEKRGLRKNVKGCIKTIYVHLEVSIDSILARIELT
jgi:hypothetical protein